MATSTQTTYNNPSQYVQDLLTREGSGLFPQLSDALDSSYQRYYGPRVAGFSQDQLNAFKMARDSVGATNPQEQAAQDLLGQSQQSLESGGQAAQDLLDQGISQGSDWLTQALGQAQNIAGQGNPLYGQAQDLISQSAQGPTSDNIQQYMNPYQSDVIDATMGELNRQDAIARQGRNAQAVSAGAFGSGRQGVVEAEAGRNLSDVKARTLAQLNSQNFNQAMNTFQNQQQMQGQAGQSLGNLGAQQVGTQQQAIAQMLQGGGNLASLFTGGAGTQAGLTGQQAAGYGDLATKNLGLGSFIREQDMADITNLFNMGQRQQAQTQAGMDVAYQDWAAERAYEDPRAKVGFMSDIIRGAPQGSTSVTQAYTPDPSPLQQIAGIAPLALAFL